MIIMKTSVIYKIGAIKGNSTIVYEFWDDILVYKWRVHKMYRGGDILDFMTVNNATRIPNFDGIDEYHKRTFILDF